MSSIYFTDSEDEEEYHPLTYNSLVPTGPMEPYVMLSYMKSIDSIFYKRPVFTAEENKTFIQELFQQENSSDESYYRWCVDLLPPRFWSATSCRRVPCDVARVVFDSETRKITFMRYSDYNGWFEIGVNPTHFSCFTMGLDSICPKKLLHLSLRADSEKTAEQCRAIMRVVFGINRPMMIPQVDLMLNVQPLHLPAILAEICYSRNVNLMFSDKYSRKYDLITCIESMRRMEHVYIPCKHFKGNTETWILALEKLLKDNKIIQSIQLRVSLKWLHPRGDVAFFTTILETTAKHQFIPLYGNNSNSKLRIVFKFEDFNREFQELRKAESYRTFLKKQHWFYETLKIEAH